MRVQGLGELRGVRSALTDALVSGGDMARSVIEDQVDQVEPTTWLLIVAAVIVIVVTRRSRR
jgi:hypothetical protein